MKEGLVRVPVSTPAPVKTPPKAAQEQQLTASLPPAPTVDNLHSNSKANEIGNGQESERKQSSMLPYFVSWQDMVYFDPSI